MEAQIIDVDCAQVGLGPEECSWSASFRAGNATLSKTGRATQVQKRDRKKGYSFVVRLWCKTPQGLSLCVVVSDAWSTTYRLLKERPASELANLAVQLQNDLCVRAGAGGLAEVKVVCRRTTRGYVADHSGEERILQWLQIRVASAFLRGQIVPALKRAQEQQRLDVALPQQGEARVEVHAEFLEARGLRPGGWLRLSADVWGTAEAPQGSVFCDMIVQVRSADLSAASIDTIAPIRLLSWDIECHSPSGAFPSAEKEEDKVIAIGVCCRTLFAADGSETRTVLTLGDAVPVAGRAKDSAESFSVTSCATELELLERFAEAVMKSNADVLVGYNTCGFDWRYLRARMDTLECLDSLLCQRWSRLPDLRCRPEEQQLGSSAMGDNPLCYPRTPGRVGVDLWFVLKRQNSPDLANLKLNTVSRHYLKDEKVDLPAKQMFAEYERGPEGRYVVAEYCCKDCVLVLDLVERLCVLPELLEMANVTCTIPEDLLYRGQQIKVYTLLLHAAHSVQDGPLYVVEDPMDNGAASHADNADDEEAALEKYKGAHVEEPKTGYYRDPIITVDFASLYPSLMRTFNLSPDTLLVDEQCDFSRIPHVEIETSPNRPMLRFVKSAHKRGLMPRILDALLHERKRVKQAMNAEPDVFKRSLLNAKQLALKVSANSVYGACGATRGLLQCREVAEATTATGRQIIAFTKQELEQSFEAAPGCEVIYGDTDSAFVRLPPALRDISEDDIFALGEDMAAFVTRRFSETLPIGVREQCAVTLEMEKYLRPLVLYKKKRYVGKSFEEKGKKGKLLVKGIELVRRDAVPLVRKAQADVVDALLEQQDAELAITITKDAALSVLQLQAGGPFGDITLSKSLRQSYANPEGMPHVKVAALMDARDAGSAPRVGDRVEYVVVASECARVVDKVEDVGHAQAAALPPDWFFYVEALERPMLRMLEVPLRFLDETLSDGLSAFFTATKLRAAEMRRRQCMVRYGLKWVPGIASKNGPPQQMLTTIFEAQRERGAVLDREEHPEIAVSVGDGRASSSNSAPRGERPPERQLLPSAAPDSSGHVSTRSLLCDTGARKRKAAKGRDDAGGDHGSSCMRLLGNDEPGERKAARQSTLA